MFTGLQYSGYAYILGIYLADMHTFFVSVIEALLLLANNY